MAAMDWDTCYSDVGGAIGGILWSISFSITEEEGVVACSALGGQKVQRSLSST